MLRRFEEIDMFLSNPARVKCLMAFWREAIGVEGDKRVDGLGQVQGMIQAEQTGQVIGVRD